MSADKCGGKSEIRPAYIQQYSYTVGCIPRRNTTIFSSYARLMKSLRRYVGRTLARPLLHPGVIAPERGTGRCTLHEFPCPNPTSDTLICFRIKVRRATRVQFDHTCTYLCWWNPRFRACGKRQYLIRRVNSGYREGSSRNASSRAFRPVAMASFCLRSSC